MTIVFGGGELGAFVPSDANATENTSAGMFDPAFSRCAMHAGGGLATYAETAAFAPMDELWVHFALIKGSGSGGSTSVQALVLNDGTDNLFQVLWDYTNSTLQMQYWNGSAWTNTGAAFSINITSSIQPCDLYVLGNSASGECALYIDGNLRSSATGVNLTTVNGITKVRCYGRSTVSGTAISQVVVASESTIGFRLATAPVTSAGATTDWTGTYTEIDEIVHSDADFINSATNGQVELFAHGTTVPSGYRVKAVIVTARAKRGSSGPANIQLALKSGATTYFTSSQALGVGYGAHVGVWETDPATSAAFTAASIAALQYGVKAVT